MSRSGSDSSGRGAWAGAHGCGMRAAGEGWAGHVRRALLAQRTVWGCLLVAGLAGCTAGQRRETVAAVDVPYQQADWEYRGRPGTKLTTPHYVIYTTLREPRLVGWLPQTMETALRLYEELIPPVKTASERRMPVYLFAAREEFEDFTRRTFGPRAELLTKVRNGGYMERGVTVIEYTAHPVTFPVLTHEGFHQYLYHRASPKIPAWLNEGLAVACEGQRWGTGGLRAFDKWFNPARRNNLAEALVRDETFDLSELLQMNAGHVVGGRGRDIRTYYAQVWLLALFLQEADDGRYADDFARLLATVGRQDLTMHARAAHVADGSRPFSFGRELFRAFFSDDLEAVGREYQAFMRARVLGERAPAIAAEAEGEGEGNEQGA